MSKININNNTPNDIIAKSIHHYIFTKVDDTALINESIIYLPNVSWIIVARRFIDKRTNYCDSVEDVLKIEAFKQHLQKLNTKLMVLNQFDNNLEPMWDDENHTKIAYGENDKFNIFYVIRMIINKIYEYEKDIPADFSLLVGDIQLPLEENQTFTKIIEKYNEIFGIKTAPERKNNNNEWERDGNYNKLRLGNAKKTTNAIVRAKKTEKQVNELLECGMTTREALRELGVPINTWKSWKFNGWIGNNENKD